MHTKFGLSQIDFEKMVDEDDYVGLAQKLKENLEKGKISKGDYENGMNWVRKSAQAKGKSL